MRSNRTSPRFDMITNEEIQRAFDFLRESAPKIADARHDKVRMSELRKVIWSELRIQAPEGNIAEKDAWAYAHKRYKEHIDEMANAERRFQLLYAQREAATSKISAWQTYSANERGAHRAAS